MYQCINRVLNVDDGHNSCATTPLDPAAMENLTHTLAGWQLAQLTPFRGVGPRAGIIAMIAANLPDGDVLLYALDADEGNWQHRGLTHSFLGWPFLALAGAATTQRWLRTGTYRDHLALWAASLFSHAMLDWPTTWGTLLLWPLSDHRFGLELVFIVDPAFWLLLGALPVLLVRRFGIARSSAAIIALLSVLGWYATAGILKELAESRAPEPVTVIPAPLAPWNWTGITPDTPNESTIRRYWLTPTQAEAAPGLAAITPETRALLKANHATERDLWMRVAPAVHHDIQTNQGRELSIVDLGYTSWLSPDLFRFGSTYRYDKAGVLQERIRDVEGSAQFVPAVSAP